MFVERYAYDETMHTQGSNSSLSQGVSFVKGLGAGVAIGMGKDGESKGIMEGESGEGALPLSQVVHTTQLQTLDSVYPQFVYSPCFHGFKDNLFLSQQLP